MAPLIRNDFAPRAPRLLFICASVLVKGPLGSFHNGIVIIFKKLKVSPYVEVADPQSDPAPMARAIIPFFWNSIST